MVGKEHNNVMKDIRRIIEQLGEVKSYQSYFIESTYTNTQNKTLPNFLLTKKGCELFSTRMTGEKGTQFAVAEVFGKKHKHILDAVSLLKNGVAEFSADPQSSLFAEGFYTHPQNKQEYPKYYMNKDGFTLLVMGFTGKKALQFKLKYIEAFNAMEKQLKQLAEQPVQQINTDQDKVVSKLLNYVDFLESKLDELTGKLKEPVESVKQLLPDVSVFEQIYKQHC